MEHKSMKFAFVILNYNLVETTMDCIVSIQRHVKKHKYMIIVVDNNSPNGAGKELAARYKDHPDVFVLINDENLGFAKGNNIGITFAVENGVDFVVCLNNDTLLLQNDFCDIVVKEFNTKPVAVIGPKILLKDGRECHIDGKLLQISQYKEMLESIGQNKPGYDLQNRNVILGFIKNILKKSSIISHVYDRYFAKTLGKNSKYFNRTYDVILHGCCLIFTPDFFSKLKGFNPDTFMYREEELLYAQIKLNHMHTLYCPELKIVHLEDVSTDTVVKNIEEKRIFIDTYQKQSLHVLIKFLELYQDKIFSE